LSSPLGGERTIRTPYTVLYMLLVYTHYINISIYKIYYSISVVTAHKIRRS